MSDSEFNHIRDQVGDIREDVGELRADVRNIRDTITRMDDRVEEHHRDNLAAALRQDSAIASLASKIAASNGETKAKSQIGTHVWTASYTLLAGFIGAVATWLMGGSGSAHP